jgi:hypothetical protein
LLRSPLNAAHTFLCDRGDGMASPELGLELGRPAISKQKKTVQQKLNGRQAQIRAPVQVPKTTLRKVMSSPASCGGALQRKPFVNLNFRLARFSLPNPQNRNAWPKMSRTGTQRAAGME